MKHTWETLENIMFFKQTNKQTNIVFFNNQTEPSQCLEVISNF